MHDIRLLAAIGAAAFLAPSPASAPDPAPLPSFAEPSISPDGREIAFVSAGDIWTVPAQGGEARLLVSNEANESRPLYSPDGTRLAFVSTRTGNGDIYVLALATGQVQRITYDDQAEQLDAWSRDGKWLYFSTTATDISGSSDEYRVSAEGGTPMPVAADRYESEYWGAPSPDGRTLAITARGTTRGQWWRLGHSHLDQTEIDLVRDVSGVPTYQRFVGMGSKNEWPMWSPDGATIYFVSDRGVAQNLYSQAVGGGTARQLTTFKDGRVLWPAISADGKTIVFERDFGIWRYDIASNHAAPVAISLVGSPAVTGVQHLTLTNGIQQLALSPDGRKMAFVVHGDVFAAPSREGGPAKRVTHTPADESQVQWSPDSRKLVYASDRDGAWNLFMYDFTNDTETQLTRGSGTDVAPRFTPDGKAVIYVRDAHEVRLHDLASNTDRVLTTATLNGRPPFIGRAQMSFSPDGQWVVILPRSGPRAFQNASVVRLSDGETHPVSFIANTSAGAVAWSRDGTYLLMLSNQRTENPQLSRVDLVPRTPHFREDQFRNLFREQTPRITPQNPSQSPTPDTVAERMPRSDSAPAVRPRTPTRIAFDGIRERLQAIPIDLQMSDIQISPDGRTALLTASDAGQTNLWTISLDDLQRGGAIVPRQLTSTPGGKGNAQWAPDGRDVYFVDQGRIAMVSVETRAIRQIPVAAEMDVDFAREKEEVFEQAWSYLRDNYFNPQMNGVNWTAVRAEYAPRIAGARTTDEMRRILSLMVGELNSSHSGIGGPGATQLYSGHIGVRFDREEYERDGRLRITEVVPLSPAAVEGIKVGDYLTSVDGTPIGMHTNLDSALAYHIGKRTVLGIASSAGAPARDVAVQPVNGATDKELLYRAWVEQNRAYVDKASGGRLGYVHMLDMSENALHQLIADLDAQNMEKEGVVIDVRNNNGGFVNGYALDILARQPYLRMQPRGQGVVPARTQLGQRALELPTVLVTNQHTLSDGEDFTEGYRAMHLGKVVGDSTAGWIIYTSNGNLIDGTTVRLPSTRVMDLHGKDMELHPRPVDVLVVRPVGESYTHKDSQLDAAVRELLGQTASAQRTITPGAP